MIRSFRDKETERICSRQRSRKLPADIQRVAFRKLRMLNRSSTLNDLKVPPANRLEKLRGHPSLVAVRGRPALWSGFT